MPTIEISKSDLSELVGEEIGLEEFREEAVLQVKGEMEEAIEEDGDVTIKISIDDTNRPDLWSAEGIVRVLRGHYGKEAGLPDYGTSDSEVTVEVDEGVEGVRPYTVCAVVRNLDMTEEALEQSVQLQEKVSGTFGRGREQVAIGIYDLSRIEPPIRYTTRKPDGESFVPLEFREEMTLEEILKKHPKGREFGHLLGDEDEYPVFIDSRDNVLSMPPIINSRYTGKVTEETEDVFIECSGFDLDRLMTALNVVALALADRGGELETVRVEYPDDEMETPDLTPREAEIKIDYLNNITGLDLDPDEAAELLERQRYGTDALKTKVNVEYLPYRDDILHQRDVLEDVVIAYGYNELEPESPDIPGRGRMLPEEKFTEEIEEVMVGLSLQEIASYTLINKYYLFDRMRLEHGPVAEIANPISENWSCFRSWLLPGVLEFLSNNRHVGYPQRVFEIGKCVVPDQSRDVRAREVRKLAFAVADTGASYERIASLAVALMEEMDLEYELKESEHESFIEGRTAEIRSDGYSLGTIGEIHPQVLNNWGLEKPVLAAEINLDKLMDAVAE